MSDIKKLQPTHKAKRYLSSYSSLSLLNDHFKLFQLDDLINKSFITSERKDIDSLFKSIAGLFSLGKYELDNIDKFTTNRYFQDSFSIEKLSSGKTLKIDLEKHAQSFIKLSKEMNANFEKQAKINMISDYNFIFINGPSGKNDVDHYVKNTNQDPYVTDFKTHYNLDGINVLKSQMIQALVCIHLFTTNCLKFIAYQGLTGEISPTRSLFTENSRQRLDENGYLIIEGVLTNDEVRNLRAIVIKFAQWEAEMGTAYYYGGFKNLQRIYNLLNKHEIFRELIQRPIVLEIMEHLFDRDTLHDKYVLASWHANIIGEGGPAQILHVDAAVPEPLPPWIIRANINYMLNDYTNENGATLCLPGSHRFLAKPKQADQHRNDLVPMLAPKGSLAIWHGHLWHRSGENKTKEDRIALLGGFAASHLREMCIEENHLQIIDEEITKNMSPALQRWIGVGHGIKRGALQKSPNF